MPAAASGFRAAFGHMSEGFLFGRGRGVTKSDPFGLQIGLKKSQILALTRQWGIKQKQLDSFRKSVVKQVILEVGLNLIDLNPIDTGRMIANWRLTKNSPAKGFAKTRMRKSRTANVEAIKKLVAKKVSLYEKGVGTFYWTNNAPYASIVEFGGHVVRPDDRRRVRMQAIWANINRRKKRGTDHQNHVGGFTQRAPSGVARPAVMRTKAKNKKIIRQALFGAGLKRTASAGPIPDVII